MTVKRLLFLASGRGSNFAAAFDAIASGQVREAKVVGLICNKSQATVLELAAQRQVPTRLLDSGSFRSQGKWNREGYEHALVAAIRSFSPDFICLAGYMLLLGKPIVTEWAGRILNIHPSLLPAFRGLNAQRQAVDYGVRWSGCTVHLVTEDLDAGPIIEQSTIEVFPEDTEETLSARLLPIEHRTYVQALKKICSRSFQIDGQKIIWGDG